MSGGGELMVRPGAIAVVGLGNVLLGDDGFGPWVIERLRARWDAPPDVAFIDAGTPGLHLVSHLAGRDHVILVDTVASKGEPGDLRFYRGEALRRLTPKPRVSPHDPALVEALGIADLAGEAPQDVLLVGAIPRSVEVETQLTAELEQAVIAAEAAVIAALDKLGVVLRPRDSPQLEPPLWAGGRTAGPLVA